MISNLGFKKSNTSPMTLSFLDGVATSVESRNNGVLLERYMALINFSFCQSINRTTEL